MVRIPFFISVFFGLTVLVSVSSLAADSRCAVQREAMPEFLINLSVPEPDMNLTKSQRFLTNEKDLIRRDWARTPNEKVWMEKGYMPALLRGGMGWTVGANIDPVSDADGKKCPVFENIYIEIYYASVIFIAEEVREDSCDFHVVLNHQLQHHDINKDLLKTLPDRLRDDLPAVVEAIESYPPIYEDGVNQRIDLMKRNIGDLIDAHLERLIEEMDVENAKIDTIQEYVRSRDMCEIERRFEKQLAPAHR